MLPRNIGFGRTPGPDVPGDSEAMRAIVAENDLRQGVSLEARERRQRSLARLRAEGVPFVEWLPVIETEGESRRRTDAEVAGRALALTIVALRAVVLDQGTAERMGKAVGAGEHFSPRERAFLVDPAPTEETSLLHAWRFEAAHTLLWAVGLVPRLDPPGTRCDPGLVASIIDGSGPAHLRDATLRPQAELLDEADLIYRYHWAAREAGMGRRPAPEWLDPGVVYERHYALNWVIGHRDQEWDDVTTDT